MSICLGCMGPIDNISSYDGLNSTTLIATFVLGLILISIISKIKYLKRNNSKIKLLKIIIFCCALFISAAITYHVNSYLTGGLNDKHTSTEDLF